MRVLVTGAAGFIGFHVARALLDRGDNVLGVDNLNDYYDPSLKEARLEHLLPNPRFRFTRLDIADHVGMEELFSEYKPSRVVHLAAQAGVRSSLTTPRAHVHSNVVGFLNVLEGCRHGHVEHLVFASSASVYGANERLPFSVEDRVDHPISLYAATKKANELMAHVYAHQFAVPTTGLRFFTVYGPWGRPDMAMFKFVERIRRDRPIDLYDHGRHRRDFTFIDDVVAGVLAVLDRIAPPVSRPDADHDASTPAPYAIYNLGNGSPVELSRVIECLESALGKSAWTNLVPRQPGDVSHTHADVSAFVAATGLRPSTPLETGVRRFVDWHTQYYRS